MPHPLDRRRCDFGPGRSLPLADGQDWPLSDPAVGDVEIEKDGYAALLAAVVEADGPEDGLRAELALAIHLLDAHYDLPPLILGALLDFPAGDPALSQFQAVLHELAMDHARTHPGELSSPPYLRRFSLGFGLFRRPRRRLTA